MTPRPLLTYHFGFERRLYLPVLQAFPVDASEEDVVSDVPLSLLAAAQALGWKLGHQLLKMRDKYGKTVKTASGARNQAWAAEAYDTVRHWCYLKAIFIINHI